MALDDGLIVPVIRQRAAAQPGGPGRGDRGPRRPRARTKRLEPDDVQGGTFTITNPGQFGAVLATPIINQPQVAILDLEAIVKRPVVVERDGDDSIAIRPMTYLCLSWDHRALDGADAARFLGELRAELEREVTVDERRMSSHTGASSPVGARRLRARGARRAPRRAQRRDDRDRRPLDGARPGARRRPALALRDPTTTRRATRCAWRAAMTYKAAAAGLDLGGGKGVICAPTAPRPKRERARALLLDFGDLVESLDGRYVTAEDVGTGAADMAVIAERTTHVTGLPASAAAAATRARSRRSASRPRCAPASSIASAAPTPAGLRVASSALGHVGGRLATRLADAGAVLTISDIDPSRRASPTSSAPAGSTTRPRRSSADCDVLAPCALGGVIDAASVPRLRCRIVCGAANNQLADDRLAEALRERGITLRARLHRQRRRPDQRLRRAPSARPGRGRRPPRQHRLDRRPDPRRRRSQRHDPAGRGADPGPAASARHRPRVGRLCGNRGVRADRPWA